MESLLHAIDSALLGRWTDAKDDLRRLGDPALDGVARRLLELVSQLERAEAARTRHLATLRHEIGNPLAIAQANVEGMLDGVLERSDERLLGIQEAIEAAGALANDLPRAPREIGEAPPIRIDTFNVCALIAAEAASARGLAVSKGVELVYLACGKHYNECTMYRGDPTRVGQILRNVMINAVRYTPPGGRVEMRCDRPDGELTVVISDSGPGIGSAELPHVFEAGFRGSEAQRRVPGSGLGLAVVDQLLRRIGGNARVESIEGSGTTFVINLPAAEL
ncbi:HAMP domain-containing histidine kinase [bacterium]|nr:MAG: HAMP domain-containing histidine kinase [bacterium]